MSDSKKPNAAVTVGKVTFANDRPIAIFAGPCQMESRAHALEMASALKEIAGKLGIGLVYKTSFDKANRTSLKGRRGLGLDGALSVFAEIRERLSLPVVTDVHEASHVAMNRVFQIKAILIALGVANAVLISGAVDRALEAAPALAPLPGRIRLAALLSLLIWVSVAACGRLIAYF